MGIMQRFLDFLSLSKNNTPDPSASEEAVYSIHPDCVEDISSLPTLSDPDVLPTQVVDFKREHIKVLRRLNKHPVNEQFNGIMALEVDIPNFIPIVYKLGLIEIASFENALHLLTVNSLKQILRESTLKVSGTKESLILRIINNADEKVVRVSQYYSDFYLLTEKGQNVINQSYEHLSNEYLVFFQNMINLILSQQLNAAYRAICKKNAEKPLPPGINCDWKKRYYDGISERLNSLYQQHLKGAEDEFVAATSIFIDISGEKIISACSYLKQSYDTFSGIPLNNVEMLVRTDVSRLSSYKNFTVYQYTGLDTYQFLATLDTHTCQICGQLDGKIFPVSEKKIGINYPPMHKGCRCTTISTVGVQSGIIHQRFARDANGKSMNVPSTMNWIEWKEKYIDN